LLLDASVLLQYATTATLAGEAALDEDELRNWTTELREHLTTLLEAPAGPGRRVGLLNAAANLSLHADYNAVPQHRPLADPIPEVVGNAPDDLEGVTEMPAWMPLVDVNHAMSCMAELVDLLAEAPTYPVDSLASYFDMLAPHPGERHRSTIVCVGSSAIGRMGHCLLPRRCTSRCMARRRTSRGRG